jgi:membrane protease YdiL (CAAX protease family)
MTSDTFWDMMLNVFVVAVMPSIGEELIFRGVIQKVFSNIFRSGHLAIWMTAFVFSAIHFQFYGFIPRFILGLIFGYLFFWSGKLWLPIITHFVNNAVPTIGAYITGLEKFNTTSDYPLLRQLIILPLPIVLSLLILLYFRNRSKPDTRKEMEHSPPVNN